MTIFNESLIPENIEVFFQYEVWEMVAIITVKVWPANQGCNPSKTQVQRWCNNRYKFEAIQQEESVSSKLLSTFADDCRSLVRLFRLHEVEINGYFVLLKALSAHDALELLKFGYLLSTCSFNMWSHFTDCGMPEEKCGEHCLRIALFDVGSFKYGSLLQMTVNNLSFMVIVSKTPIQSKKLLLNNGCSLEGELNEQMKTEIGPRGTAAIMTNRGIVFQWNEKTP